MSEMENFTLLAKILHCRRHWWHGQIPPLSVNTKKMDAIGINSTHWQPVWSVFWWAGYQRGETAFRGWGLVSHKFGTQKHGVSKRRFFSKYDKINIQLKTKECISVFQWVRLVPWTLFLPRVIVNTRKLATPCHSKLRQYDIYSH